MLGLMSLMVSNVALAITDEISTQTILPSTTDFAVVPGDSVQFSVTYPAGNPETTGVGVTLYYDSSELDFVETSNLLTTQGLYQLQDPSEDTDDGDNDSATDQKIVVAFASYDADPFIDSEDMPADLYTVSFTASDNFSSATSINFTGNAAIGYSFASTPVSITYQDSTAPSITAPADVTVTATSASTSVDSATLGSATVSDDIDASPSVSYSPQGPFAVGTHTITWTATDSSGNTATDIQILTVSDTEAPTITAPANISTTATGSTTAVSLGTPVVNDKVDESPTAVADNTGPFALGTHTITWTATDASSNSSTATQTVTIEDPGAPTITAPADVTEEATDTLTVVDLGTATASDVIDGTLSVSADALPILAVGTHTVTWTATNSRGAASTATQQVTITDTTGAVITKPDDITVEAERSRTSVSIGTATASDLVDGDVEVDPVNADLEAQYSVGTTSIVWTATDSAGNVTTATQTITVTDTTAPTVTAPADQTVEATATLTSVELGTATASDLVDSSLTATASDTGPFALGTHTITWSTTDSSGNTGTATQTIIVQDTTAPAITTPDDITVEATSAGISVDVGTATATDLVDGSVDVTSDSTGFFAVGTHTVTWTATDNSNNAATAIQTITVTDIDACGLDIDNDDQVTALSDGLLLLRYLFGFTDDALTDGALSDDSQRTTAADISSYIANCTDYYDIDGDGSVQPLSDGLLVLRYEFGFTSDSLIQDVIGANATRSDASSVESYFDDLTAGTVTFEDVR